eukprot:2811399-Pleurochrysis_carterae.AAC.4
MIPQRVHNHPWPIQFTAQPLSEGETPRDEQVYASGQRSHRRCYFIYPACRHGRTRLPRSWRSRSGCHRLSRWYTQALRIAAATLDVQALNLPLHSIPTEQLIKQLSGEVRRVVNNGMGLAVNPEPIRL